jgi:hypothetical protein
MSDYRHSIVMVRSIVMVEVSLPGCALDVSVGVGAGGFRASVATPLVAPTP